MKLEKYWTFKEDLRKEIIGADGSIPTKEELDGILALQVVKLEDLNGLLDEFEKKIADKYDIAWKEFIGNVGMFFDVDVEDWKKLREAMK